MKKILVNQYTLDEEQSAIACATDKYSMVIAGAGSGKTLTIVGKIKYLLEHHIYSPEEICCISFTNEAVQSLHKKIEEACHVHVPTYTFHKLAMDILDQNHIHYSIASSDLLDYIVDEFFQSYCFGDKTLQKIVYRYFGFFWKTKNNWEKILKQKKFSNFKKLITTFILLYKNNTIFDISFHDFIKKHPQNQLLYLIYAIYLTYETEKQSSYLLDFDDLIEKAILLLKGNNCSLSYRMIIIDEFQDTSYIRFSFIQEILKQTNSSLCVVGDDYQSIYRFSGCDLSLFLHFQDYFSNAKMYKIENTYRNSQELIDVAGSFIQKNPDQIPKHLVSQKHVDKPIQIIYYHHFQTILQTILKQIDLQKSIFILARNSFHLNHYLTSYELDENKNLHMKGFESYHIRYLTIHSSKGLESDVVILLNVEDDYYGIPSLQKDEALLSLVKKGDHYPYEEERRLFYVALTRAKETVYLLVPKKNPSCFIEEIKKDSNVAIQNF